MLKPCHFECRALRKILSLQVVVEFYEDVNTYKSELSNYGNSDMA